MKPRITIDKYFNAEAAGKFTMRDDGKVYCYGPSISVGGTYHLTPAQAKKFHKWLGEAIKWMEQNK